jgi:two-component system, OmpR family, response regulator MprA
MPLRSEINTAIPGPARHLLLPVVRRPVAGSVDPPVVAVGRGEDGPMLVLVVEDDPAVRASLERSLEFEGYSVVSVDDGLAGIAAVGRHRPDAVLLDLGLPQLDGLEVCRRLRAAGDGTPILILTARDSTPDLVTGLDAGADDYLPKPFALEELLARLRALLRRRAPGPDGVPAPAGTGVLTFADVHLDVAAHQVTRAGREVELTRTEFDLLELFLRHPRQVLPRARLLSQVWNLDFDPGSNILEVYVGYLRRKLEQGDRPRLVHTVRGVGYVLKAPVEE